MSFKKFGTTSALKFRLYIAKLPLVVQIGTNVKIS